MKRDMPPKHWKRGFFDKLFGPKRAWYLHNGVWYEASEQEKRTEISDTGNRLFWQNESPEESDQKWLDEQQKTLKQLEEFKKSPAGKRLEEKYQRRKAFDKFAAKQGFEWVPHAFGGGGHWKAPKGWKFRNGRWQPPAGWIKDRNGVYRPPDK